MDGNMERKDAVRAAAEKPEASSSGLKEGMEKGMEKRKIKIRQTAAGHQKSLKKTARRIL